MKASSVKAPWVVAGKNRDGWFVRRCTRCGAEEPLKPEGELIDAFVLRGKAFILEHKLCLDRRTGPIGAE